MRIRVAGARRAMCARRAARIRVAGALALGLVAALAVAGLPALAAGTTIAASGTSWMPAEVTIGVGDTVTWTSDGGFHNVCVQKPGTTGSACDEFRNGDISADWSSYANAHTFTTAGTYAYFCEAHRAAGMTGTITVQAASTGTSTTAPEGSAPTDTTTTPTQTETTTQPADTTAPAFTSRPKRRASRQALTLELRVSEDATLRVSVYRRPPRGRAFSRISEMALELKAGRNVVALTRRTPRSGSYRVRLQLADAAGNKSRSATLRFKLS